MSEPETVLVGMPRRGSELYAGAAKAMYVYPSKNFRVLNGEPESSLITHNCNLIWVALLNLRRERNIVCAAMIHADVCPEPLWVDKLFSESESVGADVIAAVIPFRCPKGLTSTGIGDPNRPYLSRRLTLKEVFERPVTWTEENLLVNTGLVLFRIGQKDHRANWEERVHWRQSDRIIRRPDGTWKAVCRSEDWDFSQQCRDQGLTVYATRAVRLWHGDRSWTNAEPWGEYETDIEHAAALKELEVPEEVSA